MLACEKLGIVAYKDWQEMQQESVRRRKENLQMDTLYCMEHVPVFTIGRTTRIHKDIKIQHGEDDTHLSGIPLVKSERGGGMMFHNPGQIVAYPIILLRGHIRNLRTLTWLMEEAIIQTLATYKIDGFRRAEIQPGVWTEHGKIGFIGIAVRHQVVFHGCAFNIMNDLGPFKWIAPCGLEHGKITSITESTGTHPDLDECMDTFCMHFCTIYNQIETHSDARQHTFGSIGTT